MNLRFPRNRQMYHKTKTPGNKVFRFETEKKYEECLRDGWVFNPADLNRLPEVTPEVKIAIADAVAKIKEPKIHRPESLEEPTLMVKIPRHPHQCDVGECDYKGKSVRGLRMHKLHKHKVK